MAARILKTTTLVSEDLENLKNWVPGTEELGLLQSLQLQNNSKSWPILSKYLGHIHLTKVFGDIEVLDDLRTVNMVNLISLLCIIEVTRATYLYYAVHPFLTTIYNVIILLCSAIRFIDTGKLGKLEKLEKPGKVELDLKKNENTGEGEEIPIVETIPTPGIPGIPVTSGTPGIPDIISITVGDLPPRERTGMHALQFLFVNATQNISKALLIMIFLTYYHVNNPVVGWLISHLIFLPLLIQELNRDLNPNRGSGSWIGTSWFREFCSCRSPIDTYMILIGLLILGPILGPFIGPIVSNSSILSSILYIAYFYRVFELSKQSIRYGRRSLQILLAIKLFGTCIVGYYDLIWLLFELMSYVVLITDISLMRISNRKNEDVDVSLVWLSVIMLLTKIFPVSLFAAYYYITVFYQIMEFCHLPLLMPLKTCYVNGVFDLGHYNHMALFKKAKELTGAHRLIVGVMSDEDVKKYKGINRPIDPATERVKFVGIFPEVTQVIKDAPWCDVPLDLIEDYGIDCVAHSTEYPHDAEDYAYRTPKDLGIVTLIPRGEGVSTSKRIEAIIRSGKE